MKLYGVPGWGSAIAEVMLTLADMPYQFVNVDGFDAPGPQRAQLEKLNPLCQVPTLTLENGQIMSETAAIGLMVLDRCPDLAPPVGHARRQVFQRLLIWLVANVYPTFTCADHPQRWAPDAPEQLRESCLEYRKSLYRWLESQLIAAPFALGEQLTLMTSISRSCVPGDPAQRGLRKIRRSLRRSPIRSARCQNCTRC